MSKRRTSFTITKNQKLHWLTQKPVIPNNPKSEIAMKTTRIAVALALLTITSASIADTRPLVWPSGWRSPLGSTIPVTTNFGAFSKGCTNADTTSYWTYYLETGRARHLGLDADADVGDNVKSMADGRVLAVDTLWGSFWRDVIIVEHFDLTGKRFSIAYGHLVRGVSPRTRSKWRVGDVVRAGEVLGQVAGIVVDGVTTSHLHIGAMEGESSYIPGSVTDNSTSGPCPSSWLDTVSPEDFLKHRHAAKLDNSIVGWRNANGTITKWHVTTKNGKLVRSYIPSSSVHACLVLRHLAMDRGVMPARFLDQLTDQPGIHAICR